MTSKGWLRQGDPTTVGQRVVFDDSVNVMQAQGCHTVKAEIQPNDQGSMCGQPCQRAQIGKGPGWAGLGIQEGQTRWYGFAFSTNPGFKPQYTLNNGDWNFIMSFHNMPINGVWGPLAPLELSVSTEAPTDTSRAFWTYPAGSIHQVSPIFLVGINGGNQDDPLWYTKDGFTNTNRRYPLYGASFIAGHRYRVEMRITWSAHMVGSVAVWIDGTKYLDVSGVSNMWQSGGTVDSGMYPLFENYRAFSSSLPTNDVYYGGLAVGSSQADVALP
jgi:Polysaccharide lyase